MLLRIVFQAFSGASYTHWLLNLQVYFARRVINITLVAPPVQESYVCCCYLPYAWKLGMFLPLSLAQSCPSSFSPLSLPATLSLIIQYHVFCSGRLIIFNYRTLLNFFIALITNDNCFVYNLFILCLSS